MNKSDSIKEIAPALTAAIAAIEPVKKDGVNPHFRSHYATLAAVIDATREPLAANGLAVMQFPIIAVRDFLGIETVILHKSGEWIGSETTVPLAKNDPQGYGSAMTYARRYGLMAVLGIAAEDDDGNAASGAPEKRSGYSVTPPAKPQETPRPAVSAPKLTSRAADMLISIREAGSAAVIDDLMARMGDWPDSEYNQCADAANARLAQLTGGSAPKPAPVASANLNPATWYLSADKKPLCTFHKAEMRYKADGKYGPFWSCPRKTEDGKWCKTIANAEEVTAAGE